MSNLLINIWSYAYKPDCPICKHYQKWCITAAKEQWEKEFDFDFDINALKKQNKNWFDFGKICTANKDKIYLSLVKRIKCLHIGITKDYENKHF